MEKRYFHKDGHFIWVKLSVSLVRDEHGTPLHFVSHIEDITRAKAAESALREGRRLLDESQSVAGVGSWTWNLETGEPAWSVQQYLLHGVSPLSDAPALDDFLSLVHPDDRERVRNKIFDIVRKREPFRDEYRVALSGGRVKTLSVRGDYLAADPSVGLPPRIAGTAQDVTSERAARIGREETENRQRVLLSSLPDTMVVLYDAELRCRFVQGALMKELGVDRDAFEGKLLSELVTPDRLETIEPAIHRALTGVSGSLEYGAGDGRTYAVDIAPYRSEDRSITGAFSVWRDISQRRRMEDELRASREKALEASRLKSEFVANMSHEIRTPLNGVVSMAELLLDTQLNGEQSQYAQVAMTSAEALMRVINDILDFSKIEAGKLEILREDFSVRAAVDDVVEIVGVKADERGLTLDVTVGQDVASVITGDGNRVRQVLMNLVSNAVKFTSEGQVNLTVGVVDGPGSDERLRFEVADTGIGIETEKLAALFEPFSQADATTTRRYGGTGLGLCISKQLVELMGGEIGCDSQPGVGSRFWFSVPYEPGLGVEADLLGNDLTGARVLVVDGDDADRAVMQSTLASWGIEPDTAADGAAALRHLRAAAEAGRPFETALIAARLPDVDGLMLLREIGDVPALRATRLIMVVSSPIEAAAADAAGFDAQVGKPIRPSRLYNQLLTTLHRTRGAQRAIAADAGAAATLGPARRRWPGAGRRGQRHQPVRRHPPAAQLRPGRRRRRQRPRGDHHDRPHRLQRRVHGLPDARRRRLHGHSGDPSPRGAGRTPHPDHRADGARPGRRSREVPGGRHGRLPLKAPAPPDDPGRPWPPTRVRAQRTQRRRHRRRVRPCAAAGDRRSGDRGDAGHDVPGPVRRAPAGHARCDHRR